MRIDAYRLTYKTLNEQIHSLIRAGEQHIVLDNVNGQRYIGCGLKQSVQLVVNGVPGNDLAAFMNGPTILVHGSAQDAIGNTMSAGKVVVYGDAGDIVGYSMRGGKLYIRGNAGYRVGIHMKSYREKFPVIIIGGTAGDFFGEYMAGGILILLGLDDKQGSIAGNYLGTGMHGGIIYIRGEIEQHQLGREVALARLEMDDQEQLQRYLADYCQNFGVNLREVLNREFVKLIPYSHRPYGEIYAY
jgi:glutamate synthase domain-containing protein 3